MREIEDEMLRILKNALLSVVFILVSVFCMSVLWELKILPKENMVELYIVFFSILVCFKKNLTLYKKIIVFISAIIFYVLFRIVFGSIIIIVIFWIFSLFNSDFSKIFALFISFMQLVYIAATVWFIEIISQKIDRN